MAWIVHVLYHSNAIKHLSSEQKCGDSNILASFSACRFEYEDKEKFEAVFFYFKKQDAK